MDASPLADSTEEDGIFPTSSEPDVCKQNCLPVSREKYGFVQKSSYAQPDLWHEEVLEVESPFVTSVPAGTEVFSFLLLGDQNAGKSTFLHSFTYHYDRNFLKLLSILPILASSFLNCRFLPSSATAGDAIDELPFIDTDIARGCVLVTLENFLFFLDEFELPIPDSIKSNTRFVVMQFIEIGGDHLDRLLQLEPSLHKTSQDVGEKSEQKKLETTNDLKVADANFHNTVVSEARYEHELEDILRQSLKFIARAEKSIYFLNPGSVDQEHAGCAEELVNKKMMDDICSEKTASLNQDEEYLRKIRERLDFLDRWVKHGHEVLFCISKGSRSSSTPNREGIKQTLQGTNRAAPEQSVGAFHGGLKPFQATEKGYASICTTKKYSSLTADSDEEAVEEGGASKTDKRFQRLRVVGTLQCSVLTNEKAINEESLIEILRNLFEKKMTVSRGDIQNFILCYLFKCFRRNTAEFGSLEEAILTSLYASLGKSDRGSHDALSVHAGQDGRFDHGSRDREESTSYGNSDPARRPELSVGEGRLRYEPQMEAIPAESFRETREGRSQDEERKEGDPTSEHLFSAYLSLDALHEYLEGETSIPQVPEPVLLQNYPETAAKLVAKQFCLQHIRDNMANVTIAFNCTMDDVVGVRDLSERPSTFIEQQTNGLPRAGGTTVANLIHDSEMTSMTWQPTEPGHRIDPRDLSMEVRFPLFLPLFKCFERLFDSHLPPEWWIDDKEERRSPSLAKEGTATEYDEQRTVARSAQREGKAKNESIGSVSVSLLRKDIERSMKLLLKDITRTWDLVIHYLEAERSIRLKMGDESQENIGTRALMQEGSSGVILEKTESDMLRLLLRWKLEDYALVQDFMSRVAVNASEGNVIDGDDNGYTALTLRCSAGILPGLKSYLRLEESQSSESVQDDIFGHSRLLIQLQIY